MTGPHPTAVARGLLVIAVAGLPAGDIRERYREELRSELCEMNAPAQVRQAASLCRGSFALRRALMEADVPLEQQAHRDWRCRLGRHSYVARLDDDPERGRVPYQVCVRCGHWFEPPDEPEFDSERFRGSNYFSGGGM